MPERLRELTKNMSKHIKKSKSNKKKCFFLQYIFFNPVPCMNFFFSLKLNVRTNI